MEASLDDLLKEQWLRARNSGQLRWKTSDDNEIPIKDMTDRHLENAIRHARKIEYHKEVLLESLGADNF